MMQPVDSSGEQRFPGNVSLVTKSLYGASQAGEIWGSLIHNNIPKWRFTQSTQDRRLYFYIAVIFF